MKHAIKLIFGLLALTNFAFGQNTDTLKVYVLTPYKVEISDNFLQEYNDLKNNVIEKRNILKEQKNKEKETNIEEYNKLPDYTKLMFDNELNFYDNLTVDNYISLLVREYIAYRLYKPFKIKPRLVFVVSTKLNSNLDEYLKFTKSDKNTFIINFPTMKLYKENNELKVKTKVELYSSLENKVVFSNETVGIKKTEMTDYPMCYNDNLDCAFVNSVYPNLFKILFIIAEKNTYKK